MAGDTVTWRVPGSLKAPVGVVQVPVDDCYRSMQAAFYRDMGAYRALLETPGCLPWDSAFYVIGGLGNGGVLGDSGGHWVTLRACCGWESVVLDDTGSVGHQGESLVIRE